MMLVLALGTLDCGNDGHITTPCFARRGWNRRRTALPRNIIGRQYFGGNARR
jgi:hypothetical protein